MRHLRRLDRRNACAGALAQQFGYPRLSCQIHVAGDMVVRLIPEKKIWGGRRQAAENHDVM
jgi:hypothetical protein